EHDYLKDGFWAGSFSEELVNEDLSASFLISMDNVTDSIIPFLSDTMSEGDRRAKIREIRERLEKALSEDGKYNVVVSSFFEGNEYYRFVYQVFTDVRLVGAPPSAIGKFGGDTDNWMWPRHTGDFSIFRVYSAPDGSPADYAAENVPLKPKHHLPVSLKGVEKDDFAMIWGYPGTTNRYITSYGLNYNLENYNPAMIDLLGKRLEIMKEDMDADRNVDIKYASTYAGLANYWKYLIGQTKGVKRQRVMDKKLAIESDFSKWIEMDNARKEKYGNIFTELDNGYKNLANYIGPLMYMSLGLLGPDIINFSQEFSQLEQQLADVKANPEAPKETISLLRESVKDHFKDYNAPTDQKVMAGMFAMYDKDVPAEQQPEFFKELKAKYKGDFKSMAADVFEKSIFAGEDKVNAFLDNPNAKKLAKDPAYVLGGKIMEGLMASSGNYRKGQPAINKSNRLFIAGLREMNPNKVYYPDANSTMRLTYGSVQDYVPADAVEYDYVTYLSGIMEKEDPTNDE
ncbi:MAG: S46 family peptidase, partial [Deltaproteobacteria bacterium]